QYFIEFPNRIIEGNVIDYLGKQIIDGVEAEGVIISWNQIEPQKDIDQYAIWLDVKTKRILKVEYTVREKFRFVKGEASFSDYKEFEGFLLPSIIASKSNIKSDGYLHIKKINKFIPDQISMEALQPF
ncbi:MAG: hypothetical protein AAFN10_15940, partial [Bacteroidota bacterium]